MLRPTIIKLINARNWGREEVRLAIRAVGTEIFPNLNWDEKAWLVGRIHAYKKKRMHNWTGTETAQTIGWNPTTVYNYLKLYQGMFEFPILRMEKSATKALKILTRLRRNRNADNILTHKRTFEVKY